MSDRARARRKAVRSYGEALAAIGYGRLCQLAGCDVPRVADVMALIAGKATGHLDLKDAGGDPAKRVLPYAGFGPAAPTGRR